jgi:hypothetical protein
MKRRVVVGWLLVGGTLALLVGAWALTRHARDTPVPLGADTTINITYPYVASPERQRQIREGFPRVRPGASRAQVIEILGTPDEVRPLYEPQVISATRVGTTYWYYLKKESEGTSLKAPVVRVAFDLGEQVTKVDQWGFDGTKE